MQDQLAEPALDRLEVEPWGQIAVLGWAADESAFAFLTWDSGGPSATSTLNVVERATGQMTSSTSQVRTGCIIQDSDYWNQVRAWADHRRLVPITVPQPSGAVVEGAERVAPPQYLIAYRLRVEGRHTPTAPWPYEVFYCDPGDCRYALRRETRLVSLRERSGYGHSFVAPVWSPSRRVIAWLRVDASSIASATITAVPATQ